MANRTLWPLFHYRIDLASFEHQWYRIYRDVAGCSPSSSCRCCSRTIASGCRTSISSRSAASCAAWVAGPARLLPAHPVPAGPAVHDHALASRARRRICAPTTRSAFQTADDRDHFADYARRELGAELLDGDWLRARPHDRGPGGPDRDRRQGGRATRPPRPRRRASTRRSAQHLGDRALIIGVDRLDYSKGIVERLRGFQALLERNIRSTAARPSSCRFRRQAARICRSTATCAGSIERLAGHIDRPLRRGRLDPAALPEPHPFAPHTRRLLPCGRVGLVTPLRDGLNLVAEEYVVAQDADDPGVLVLSRFAGAAAMPARAP